VTETRVFRRKMYNSLGKNVQQNTKKGEKNERRQKKIDNNGFEVVPLMRLPFPFPFLPMIKEKKKLSERKIVEILDASKPASRRPVAHFALATHNFTIPRRPIVLCD